jgi:methyltransferase
MRAPGWYVVLLAAVGVERLRELAVSRAHERSLAGRRAAASGYPLMVAAHVGLVTLPLLEASMLGTRRPRWGWAAVLAGATALRVWSIRSLGEQWNVKAVVPRDVRPVVSGPYRYIRHPNYLAVALEFVAVPMIAGAWISATVLSAVNAVVLYDRIRDEERLLEESPAYREAFADRARFLPAIWAFRP